MKTVIGINNLTQIDQLVYGSHMQFFFNLGRLYPDFLKDQFIMINPRRMSIDRMRNFCALVAMESESDYLLFIDDDVLLPLENKLGQKINLFDKLISHLREDRADIVAGVTLIRGYPYHPMIFDFSRKDSHYMDDYMDRADEHGLVKCDAVGFSFCAIKAEVLRAVELPHFITGEKHTEDVFFCQKAARFMPGIRIRADATIETAHILGPEVITPGNKAARMAFDESTEPVLTAKAKEKEGPRDRNENYFKRIGVELEKAKCDLKEAKIEETSL